MTPYTQAGISDAYREQLVEARQVLEDAGVPDFEPLADGYRRYCTLVEMCRNAAATIAELRAERRVLLRRIADHEGAMIAMRASLFEAHEMIETLADEQTAAALAIELARRSAEQAS